MDTKKKTKIHTSILFIYTVYIFRFYHWLSLGFRKKISNVLSHGLPTSPTASASNSQLELPSSLISLDCLHTYIISIVNIIFKASLGEQRANKNTLEKGLNKLKLIITDADVTARSWSLLFFFSRPRYVAGLQWNVIDIPSYRIKNWVMYSCASASFIAARVCVLSSLLILLLLSTFFTPYSLQLFNDSYLLIVSAYFFMR